MLSGLLYRIYAAAHPGTALVMYLGWSKSLILPSNSSEEPKQTLHGTWTKVLALRQALKDFPTADTILFVDGDTIMAPDTSIAEFIIQVERVNADYGVENAPVVLSHDNSYSRWQSKRCRALNVTWCINTGAILLKDLQKWSSRAAASRFLDAWWSLRWRYSNKYRRDALEKGYLIGMNEGTPTNKQKLAEQNAMNLLLDTQDFIALGGKTNTVTKTQDKEDALLISLDVTDKEKSTAMLADEAVRFASVVQVTPEHVTEQNHGWKRYQNGHEWMEEILDIAPLQQVNAGRQNFKAWFPYVFHEFISSMELYKWRKVWKVDGTHGRKPWYPQWSALVLHYCKFGSHKILAGKVMRSSLRLDLDALALSNSRCATSSESGCFDKLSSDLLNNLQDHNATTLGREYRSSLLKLLPIIRMD